MKLTLKALVKMLGIFGIFYWSLVARFKFFCLGKVGKGLIAEGPIFITAYSGDFYIGDNVRFGPWVRIGAAKGGTVSIGNDCSLNQGTVVIAIDRIEIGNNCRIGEYVSIRDNDHQWRDASVLIKDQGYISDPVKIGDDVWIGRGTSVMKSVCVMKGSIIGANSVVTKDVCEYSVAVGVPAKTIKKRKLSE